MPRDFLSRRRISSPCFFLSILRRRRQDLFLSSPVVLLDTFPFFHEFFSFVHPLVDPSFVKCWVHNTVRGSTAVLFFPLVTHGFLSLAFLSACAPDAPSSRPKLVTSLNFGCASKCFFPATPSFFSFNSTPSPVIFTRVRNRGRPRIPLFQP